MGLGGDGVVVWGGNLSWLGMGMMGREGAG